MNNTEITPAPTYVRKFVRISEAQKSGESLPINFHNQFAKKAHAREEKARAPSPPSDMTREFDYDEDKPAPRKQKSTPVTPKPKKATSKSQSAPPKARKSRAATVKPGDNVFWITIGGHRTLMWNNKKVTGKRAYKIYKDFQELNGGSAKKGTKRKRKDEPSEDEHSQDDDFLVADDAESDVENITDDDELDAPLSMPSGSKPRTTRNTTLRSTPEPPKSEPKPTTTAKKATFVQKKLVLKKPKIDTIDIDD